MNSESAGHREQPDVPGAPNAPSTRPRAFHRRRRTDGPAFTRPDQYLGQNFYPLRAAFADPAEATAPPATAAATPFERLSSIEGLAGAWQMVLVRDARDGLLQRQTRLIAGDLDRFLAELSASLREGTYLPAPLLRADIPKRTPGQTRVLHIPTIRDRVVERAVVNTIAYDADRIMSPCSFAYRTGIGADDAVHHLATLRDDGYRHVLRTDVEDYFPNLDVEDALAVLAPVVGCPHTIDLIRLIARPRRARGERRTRSRGIAQGSCFLGVDFSRTRPAVDPHHDIKGTPNPDEVVYVGRDGARPREQRAADRQRRRRTPARLHPPQGRQPHCAHRRRRAVRRGPLLGPAQRRRRHLPVPARRLPRTALRPARHRQRAPTAHPGRLRRRRRGPPAARPSHCPGQDAPPGQRPAPHRPARRGRRRRPLGVLHASTDKRPSLSLDLMEEFRPLLVDRTVMALLRSRRLRPEHATVSGDGEGVWLDKDGKKALVDGYEATLQRQVKDALPGFAGTWRRHIHHQAQLLGRAIVEPDYRWSGASWR